MTVLDFNAARFAAAKDCADVSPRDTLAEALRRIDAGQWKMGSVIIVGLNTDYADGGTAMELMHGGPAGTNERLGMLVRSTNLIISNVSGDHG